MPITRGQQLDLRLRISADPPILPQDGDLWWDTDDDSFGNSILGDIDGGTAATTGTITLDGASP